MNRKLIIGIIIAIIVGAVATTTLVVIKSANSAEHQLDLGYRFLEDGDYEEAILHFERVLDIDEKNYDAYIGLAQAYIELEEFEDAIDALEEAVDIDDDYKDKEDCLDDLADAILDEMDTDDKDFLDVFTGFVELIENIDDIDDETNLPRNVNELFELGGYDVTNENSTGQSGSNETGDELFGDSTSSQDYQLLSDLLFDREWFGWTSYSSDAQSDFIIIRKDGIGLYTLGTSFYDVWYYDDVQIAITDEGYDFTFSIYKYVMGDDSGQTELLDESVGYMTLSGTELTFQVDDRLIIESATTQSDDTSSEVSFNDLFRDKRWYWSDDALWKLEVDEEKIFMYIPESGSYTYDYFGSINIQDNSTYFIVEFEIYETDLGIDLGGETRQNEFTSYMYIYPDYLELVAGNGQTSVWHLE